MLLFFDHFLRRQSVWGQTTGIALAGGAFEMGQAFTYNGGAAIQVSILTISRTVNEFIIKNSASTTLYLRKGVIAAELTNLL